MKIYIVKVCYDYEGCSVSIATDDRNQAYSVAEKELKEVTQFGSETVNVKLETWLHGKIFDTMEFDLYNKVIRPL